MKIVLFALCASALTAVAFDDKKDKKSPLPGDAVWELKAFESLFRVVKTDYDAEIKRVKWSVQTRDGQRTADLLSDIKRMPFTFHFVDGDGNELATVQLNKADFHGLPDARVLKEGTRLTITLDVPKAMPKTKKVVLRRGRS